MSYPEIKAVLRLPIPQLRGATPTQAYDYFRKLLGDAEDVYPLPDGSELGAFYYKDKPGRIVPVRSETWPKDGPTLWGADLILVRQEEVSQTAYATSMKDLVEGQERLAQLFGRPAEEVQLLVYTWYNGGDQPVYWSAADAPTHE